MPYINYTKELLQDAANKSRSYAEMLKNLGLQPKGGNYIILRKNIEKFQIDISVLNINKISNPKPKQCKVLRPIESYLKYGYVSSSSDLKKRLIDEGRLEYKCYSCGIHTWLNNHLTLELDHIDGDKYNNLLENLRLLCPNCHSLTSTWRGKNNLNRSNNTYYNVCISCNQQKSRSLSSKCHLCASKLQRKFDISVLELEKLIYDTDTPLSNIAKSLEISDTALRRRCRLLKINYLTRDRHSNRVSTKLTIKQEDLENLIYNTRIPLTQIGKNFGVTCNAIRKRCEKFNINWKLRTRAKMT
jgi:hypothetical protein